MPFQTLQARLVAYVNGRIQNGEFSERALARLVGVSQPQLHNVLKGARRLHTPLADALMRHFQIALADLLTPAELAATPPEQEVSAAKWRDLSDPAAAMPEQVHWFRKRPSSAPKSSRREWEAS